MIEKLKIIEASAGTGKTFSLSSQLILLLATGIHPSKILALTFTKKAAGEIRNRVFERLAHASSDNLKAEELSKQIGIKNIGKERYSEILKILLADNKRINISTIDGFFNQIARLFTSELSLPNNWKISEESVHLKLVRDAILNAFSHSSKQQVEMLNLLRLLNRDESDKKIIGRAIDISLDYVDKHRVSSHFDFNVDMPNQNLDLEGTLERIKKLEIPQNKSGGNNKKIENSINSSIALAKNKNWYDLLDKGIPKAIIEKNSSFNGVEIPESYLSEFSPLINYAKQYLLNKFREKTLSTRRLLELIRFHYLELKNSLGCVTFNDIQFSLEENQFNREEIYARLDNKYDHILIDEFQDTSTSQWNILEPFIHEIVFESNKTCFVVGDKKQAIYGWRGGKAEIFDNFKSNYPQAKVELLSNSYRSSNTIIKNVNRVFQNLAQNPALEEYKDIAVKWTSDFPEHSTVVNKPGLIKYEVYEDELNLVEQVHEILAQNLNIGILVQRNDEVQKVIEILAKSPTALNISMEGGTSLAQSRLVHALLAAVRLLENPSDTEQFFVVCNSPILDRQLEVNQKNAVNFSKNLLGELSTIGFAKLIHNLVNKLKPYANFAETRRLERVLEISYLYDETDYMLFCETIERTKFSAASEQSIRVMTIHQSKGLEFDAVILPFLTKDISKTSSSILTIAEDQLLPYPNELIRNLSEQIKDAHSDITRKRVEEYLSVLYVALTRARQNLYVYLSKPRGLSLEKILLEEFSAELSENKIFLMH